MARQLKHDCAVELISAAADLEELRADWQLLWERAGSTTPFQSPEWLIPWCRIFAANGCAVLGDALSWPSYRIVSVAHCGPAE
jgi:CelD/BcsL family acetyltransferase involved in cellulose biosynthesis